MAAHADHADGSPTGLPWADLHPLAVSPHPHPRHDSPHLCHDPEAGGPGQAAGSTPGSLSADDVSQQGEDGAGPSGMDSCLAAIPHPLVAAWDVAGHMLSAAEAPIWALRRATIPLLEAECYSRPWCVCRSTRALQSCHANVCSSCMQMCHCGAVEFNMAEAFQDFSRCIMVS